MIELEEIKENYPDHVKLNQAMLTLNIQIVDLIYTEMKKQNMYVWSLEREMGVADGYFTRLRGGERNITIKMLAKVQKVLGIEFELIVK